jgi:tetratricopeptide (TPR) repeat protein
MRLDVSKGEVQTYYGVLALGAILGVVAFFVPVVSLSEMAFGMPVSAGASGVDSVRLAFWLLDNFGKHMEAGDVLRVCLLFFPLSFFSPAGVLIKVLVSRRPDRGVGCAISAGLLMVVGLIYAKAHFFDLAGVGFWLGEGALLVPLVVHAIMGDSLAAAQFSPGAAHGMGGGMAGAGWASPVQSVVQAESPAEELRRCPFCAEWIKKAAVRCRFCHADVPPDSEEASKQAAKSAADAQAAAVAAAGEHIVAQEAEGLQAARELALAGSWDEAKEFLNALLMRAGSPPASATVGDYVLLASAETKSGALGPALDVLKHIPRELKGEAGSEAASTLATLGRDAVVRKDVATAQTVREIAQRLHAYSGTTACVVGSYLDVQSAEDALQSGDDRVAAMGLEGAREFLRSLPENERLPGLEEQIASVERQIKEKQQRRQKRVRIGVGLSLLGVVAASAGVYFLVRWRDESKRDAIMRSVMASQRAIPDRAPGRTAEAPTGTLGSSPGEASQQTRVRVVAMPGLFDYNGRKMAEWKPLLDLIKKEDAEFVEYDGRADLGGYDILFWNTCDRKKNQMLFPRVADLLRQRKYIILAGNNSCMPDRDTYSSDLANTVLTKYGMRMNRDDLFESYELTTVGAGPLVRGVPGFLGFRHAGIELLPPRRAGVEVLARDSRQQVMAAYFVKGGGILLAYGGGEDLLYGVYNKVTNSRDYRVLGILRNLIRNYRNSQGQGPSGNASVGAQAELAPPPSAPQNGISAEPCALAHSSDLGDPLATALKLVEKKAAKPTDVDHFREAVAQAENATRIDPQCAEAWSVLAFARYRLAYDICGRGDYASAEEAGRKALELNPTPTVKSSALRNLGRIATARLAWDEAESLFNQARAVTPDNREVKSWLAEFNLRKSPRPEMMAAVAKALAGELLTEDDTKSLVIDEVPFLMNALLARHGRRMNSAVQDWFFFCDGTPVQNHPTVDPNVSRDPIRKGTPDFDNVKFLQDLRKRLKSGAMAAE